MEYIGLIGVFGLGGLVGYFSADKLRNIIQSVKKSLLDTESRIARSEKFISDLQNEIDKLNSQLQNYASRTDLNGLSNNLTRQIQSDLQKVEKNLNAELKNYAALSSVKNLEDKISDAVQNSDLQNLQSALQDIKRNIAALEDKFNTLERGDISTPSTSTAPTDNAVKILEQRLSALEADNQNLTKKLADQNALITQHQNYFAQIQTAFNNMQNNFVAQSQFSEQLERQKKFYADFEERFKKFDERLKKLEGGKTDSGAGTTTPPVPPIKIDDFQVKKSNRQFFTNDPRDAEKSLATAEKVSEIIDFLKNSNFAKRESFIQLIENYRRNLQKFADKLKRGKFDEDNFSEEASKAFFSTLSKYFLTALPVSIYRGNKENPAFYSAFLKKINEYLAACHVYTELIKPQKFMTHNDLEKMTIIKKSTGVKTQDKMIDEVERLPYFLEYLTEDGDIEHCCFEGTMTVMKFEGGVK